MPAPRKPEKRCAKPGRPIPRSTKPIARSKRPNLIKDTAAAQALRLADAKWRTAVAAKGPCAALGCWAFRLDGAEPMHFAHTRCFGPVDAAHGISRRFRATRHDTDNGFPLCRTAHDWFTKGPLQWTDWLIQYLGKERYEALHAKAQGGIKA